MAKKPVKKKAAPKKASPKISLMTKEERRQIEQISKLMTTPAPWEKPRTGINPKDALGMKKVSLSKFPAAARLYGALAMMDGARKYGPYNWRENKVIASIYIDACYRHIDAWFDSNEEVAEDSGVPHLGHAIACLAILVDALETGNLDDDRPVPGVFAELIKKHTKT